MNKCLTKRRLSYTGLGLLLQLSIGVCNANAYGNNVSADAGASSKQAAVTTEKTGNATLVVAFGPGPSYKINGEANPELVLKRGQTYIFEINTPGHPFWIKTELSASSTGAYNSGVTGNGATSGSITFAVPADAPAALFYNCEIHAQMQGKIKIVD
ncbi:MAG: cupredoxin domain-containing protein [Methylophilaceae bacterium]